MKTQLSDQEAVVAAADRSDADRGGVRGKLQWQYWHRIVLLSFLGWVFMYASRSVPSPVLPLIGEQWGLSTAELGLITSVFFLSYTAMQIPTGILADRLGRRLVLLVPGVIIAAVSLLAMGLAPSYLLMLIASAMAGAGQGTYYPTQYALSNSAVPSERRAVAAAMINSGQAFGVSMGMVISSYLALQLGGGWRLPFIVVAVPMAAVGLLFWWGVVESRHAALTAGGHNSGEDAATSGKIEPAAGARSQIWSPSLVRIYILNFCSLYGFFVILTWLPYYLITARGYEGLSVGWISSLVPWMSIPGALFASRLSDISGDRKRIALRMLPVAAVALLIIPMVKAEWLLIVTLLIYGFTGKLALDPVLLAFVADLTPPRAYSSVFGVFNFAGVSSSVLSPVVTGYLADMTGSVAVGFYLAAGLLCIGMLSLLTVRDSSSPQQIA